MRIAILNQYYLPDISPTAQLAGSLAEHRAALGDRVTVICGSRNYVNVELRERAGAAVDVRRTWTPGFGKKTVLGRLLDYACFWLLAAFRMATMPRQDVVVSMTTPPFVALLALLHRFIHRRTRVVLWVMDCYPEVAIMAGMLTLRGMPARVMRWLNRVIANRCTAVVCLDGAMKRLVEGYRKHGSKTEVVVIPNWERAEDFPVAANVAPWEGIDRLGLTGKFVVLYIGNAGQGHTFETVLQAAEELRSEPIAFLYIGGGAKWPWLRAEAEKRSLTNVILQGYVPKHETPRLMASCHCALITLRDEAVGLISPSKLHSNLAAGLPILYIGPAGSNVDEAIAAHGVGLSARHGDAKAVVAFLRSVSSDAAALGELCTKARAAFEDAFCDRRTLARFDEVLTGL